MAKKVIIESIIGIVLLGFLVTGIFAILAFRQPMANPLNVVVAATPTVNSEINSQTASEDALTSTPTAAATAPAAATATAVPTVPVTVANVCGSSGAMSVLVIGRDETQWELPYGADAIRLVKVDFDQKKVTVFAFQHDLLLNTPGLVTYNTSQSRLGAAYYVVRAKEGDMRAADTKASSAIAQILYDNFGVKADRYITMQENVLTDAVNTIGGVEVDVPAAVASDHVDLVLNLNAGKQTFDGATAQKYVRYLTNSNTNDEWGRFSRQGVVVKGLMQRLKDPSVYTKIPELYTQFQKSVVTDLSPAEIVSLGCMARDMTFETVKMDSIPLDLVTLHPDGTMTINNMDAVIKLIHASLGL
jgi:LCP family protein required for cell wall assembly